MSLGKLFTKVVGRSIIKTKGEPLSLDQLFTKVVGRSVLKTKEELHFIYLFLYFLHTSWLFYWLLYPHQYFCNPETRAKYFLHYLTRLFKMELLVLR